MSEPTVIVRADPRDALADLSAAQLGGYHAVITALQEAC